MAANREYQQGTVYREIGGAREVVSSGASLDVESGGVLDIESGGALKIAGTDVTAILATSPAAVAAGYKIARGVHTTLDENDTVVTGLTTVVAVVVSLGSDPVAGCSKASATIGDQAGAPAAGSILIKTWEADETVATTFTKLVNWIAIGT